MTEEQEKVARLPSWARELVKRLEERAAPNTAEMIRLRRETEKQARLIRLQQDRIEAMAAFFQCAAKGGNEVALAVQSIVENFLTVEE